MKNLEKQYQIYSVGTEAFYNEEEHQLHEELSSLKLELYMVKELLKLQGKKRIDKFNEFVKSNKDDKNLMIRVKKCVLETELHDAYIKDSKENLKEIKSNNKLLRGRNSTLRKTMVGSTKEERQQYKSEIEANKQQISVNKEQIESIKENLQFKSPKRILSDAIKCKKEELINLLKQNTDTRILRDEYLKLKNAISLFDSTLSRTLGMTGDDANTDINTDIIVVQTYYYNVLQDIITNGFVNSDGEEFIYFSSSAGQIRTKKAVFIKKILWEQHENTLMCGLSVESINNKGGINLTKYQAYKALCNSASVEWKEFDIHKAIVVDDLEVEVHSMVDYINRDTYEITPEERDIPIEMTDGCGIMLPSVSEKSFQVRLPFVKGLLVPFAFDKFVEKHEGANPIVTDIYGDTHNVIEEGIEVIFTKSQFKMWKYYDNWKEYRDNYDTYKCKAAKLNEEDTSGNATLTYQMLQTLTDISDEELQQITYKTKSTIENMGKDKDTMLEIMGANDENEKKNYFQQALNLYPSLLNDEHTKETIKSKKKAIVNDAKAGKLMIEGAKYTFIIPDLYAFAQNIFGLEVTGLLDEKDVYCRLYDEGEMVLLRSPHLYREWGIRNNVKYDKAKEWFLTDGVYTSIHDNISKMLQFDNDGDKSLCLQGELVDIAKRNMQGVNPLYYEMAKAGSEQITGAALYSSLREAYKANIGVTSNQITKIWANDINEEALLAIRWLCMESNFQIDRAKTNFMTVRPPRVDAIIKKLTGGKMVYFFKYAKPENYGDEEHGVVIRDKDNKIIKDRNGKTIKLNDKVELINNSTINRLESIIDESDSRISFKKVAGKFDYKQLMRNPKVKMDDEVATQIIEKYTELNNSKKFIMNQLEENDSRKISAVYKYIRKELQKIATSHKIADVLVKHLYGSKTTLSKETLWKSFGKEIVANLNWNLSGIKTCKCCGEKFKAKNNKELYCSDECKDEVSKKQNEVADKKYKAKTRNEIPA